MKIEEKAFSAKIFPEVELTSMERINYNIRALQLLTSQINNEVAKLEMKKAMSDLGFAEEKDELQQLPWYKKLPKLLQR